MLPNQFHTNRFSNQTFILSEKRMIERTKLKGDYINQY